MSVHQSSSQDHLLSKKICALAQRPSVEFLDRRRDWSRPSRLLHGHALHRPGKPLQHRRGLRMSSSNLHRLEGDSRSPCPSRRYRSRFFRLRRFVSPFLFPWLLELKGSIDLSHIQVSPSTTSLLVVVSFKRSCSNPEEVSTRQDSLGSSPSPSSKCSSPSPSEHGR